jgi:DnaK suppressor protein
MISMMSHEEDELSDVEINMLRERLKKRLIELEMLSESSQSSRNAVDLDQSRVGRLSRIDALQMQAMEQAAEARRGLERQRIHQAFTLIERGDYGYCVNCGEPIAVKRLKFDPSLITCVTCA